MITDKERAFFEKFEKLIESAAADQVLHFTPEEIKALKSVAARERAWASIGALAGSAKTILTWIGFMIAAWMAFKAGFVEWITTAIGQAK